MQTLGMLTAIHFGFCIRSLEGGAFNLSGLIKKSLMGISSSLRLLSRSDGYTQATMLALSVTSLFDVFSSLKNDSKNVTEMLVGIKSVTERLRAPIDNQNSPCAHVFDP